MTKPKLEDAQEVALTVKQVRDGTAEEVYDLLSTALDEAQANVFSGEAPYAYLVIKIIPG